MDSSISVAVRVRPFNAKELPLVVSEDDDDPFLGDGGLSVRETKQHKRLRSIVSVISDRVLVFDPPDREALKRLRDSNPAFCHGNRPNKDARYAFDSVYGDQATQQDIYHGTVEPMLDGVMNGYNATVFAYGATGCGKTHTISGTPEDPGLIFLTMSDLFQRSSDVAAEKTVNIKLSYLEIYNEQIRDLLSTTPTPPGQGLPLRDSVGPRSTSQKITVVGLTEHTPQSPQEVLNMITEGNKRRTMSPTEANAVSSRSHAVLQVNVTQRPKDTGLTEECTSASFNIIDLAGSERASATRNRGQRMMEGANINRSLLALANCINALCRPAAAHGNVHVPYRDSKLTRLLKFSLGGNCRTVMIVCVSPSSAHFEETQKTLKYANSAKCIRTKVSQNLINVDRHVESYAKAILELQEQNARLKSLLEQGKSLSTDVDQRKKDELAQVVSQAKAGMQNAATSYLAAINAKAAVEAKLDAAKVQVEELRMRLSDAQVQAHSNPSATVASQVAVLQSALVAQEAVVVDRELNTTARTLEADLRTFINSLSTALRNPKLDGEAKETLNNWSAKLRAEGEAARAKAQYQGMRNAMRDVVSNATGFLLNAIGSTVALRQAANGMEQRASNADDAADPNGDWVPLTSPLRTTAQANDDALYALTGQATLATSDVLRTPPVPTRTRARPSFSSKRAVSEMRARPMRRVSMHRTAVSPKPVAASYASPTQASRTKRTPSGVDSPRRRRNSAFNRGRPSVATDSGMKRSGSRRGLSSLVKSAALRWTGEGKSASPVRKSPSPVQRSRSPARPPVEVPRPVRSPTRTLDLSPTKSVVTRRLAPAPNTSESVRTTNTGPTPSFRDLPNRSPTPSRMARSPSPPEPRPRNSLKLITASPQHKFPTGRAQSPSRLSAEMENLPPLSATRRTPKPMITSTRPSDPNASALLSAPKPSARPSFEKQVTTFANPPPGNAAARASAASPEPGLSPSKMFRKPLTAARMSNASMTSQH